MPFMLGLCLSSLSAQKGALALERLSIQPFINQTNQEQWDNLAVSISNTLELTLRLTERLTIRDIGTFNAYNPDDREAMREAALSSRLDAVLIGRISPGEGQRIRIQAEVYIPSSGTVVADETRTAFGAFDVLDAADELILEVASGIAGYQIDFGALVLQPDRTDVPFRVYVDGALVGDNPAGIPQIPTGSRVLDITVVSSRGEQLVYSADLSIKPGEASTVAFSLPRVTVNEGSMVRSRLNFIAEAYRIFGAEGAVQTALNEAEDLLSGSDRETDKEELERLRTLYLLSQEYREIDTSAYLNSDSAVPRVQEFIPVAEEALDSGYGDDPEVRSLIRRSALAHLYMLDLLFGTKLDAGNWEAADAIMDDMVATRESFDLGNRALPQYRVEEYRRAREVSDELRKRRRRPIPYILSVVSAGASGFGGWMLYDGTVDSFIQEADDLYDVYMAAGPDTVEKACKEADAAYTTAELAELVQWGAIAGGGLVLTTGVFFAIRNIRRSERYMREWADESYPRLISVSRRVADYFDHGKPPGEGSIDYLVLGPDSLVTVGESIIDVPPFMVQVDEGEPLILGRPMAVPEDVETVRGSGFYTVVLE